MRPRLAAILVLAVILAVSAPATATSEKILYPCNACHEQLKAKPDRKSSSFHEVSLSGRHSGLVCVNCHNATSAMMQLVGGVNISILLFEGNLSEVARACASCHYDVYMDWVRLAHGNATFLCPGGKVETVTGYMGGIYYMHICPEPLEYEPVPAKPCTFCHDPHDPAFHPPEILPALAGRPEPPGQKGVLYGGLAVTAAGLVLIVAAPLVHARSRR